MLRLQKLFAWEEKRISRWWAVGIIAVWLIILLVAGLASSSPMLGDEYHHYAFAEAYAEHHRPVWVHEVRMASGETYTYNFNHPYLWGELLAWIFIVLGGPSFAVAQIYHALWVIPLGVSVYLLARTADRENPHTAGVWSLILLVSIPMVTLFLISFYADIPFAALNALCVLFLVRRRYIWASVAGGLALLTKLFAFFCIPAYILIIVWNERRRPWRALGLCAMMAAIVLVMHIPTIVLRRDSPHTYLAVDHPEAVLSTVLPESLSKKICDALWPATPPPPPDMSKPLGTQFCYPGDLRALSNWPRYLGLLLLPSMAWLILRRRVRKESVPLLLAVGVYVACFLRMLWHTPDVRYLSAAIVLLPALAGPVLGRRHLLIKTAAALMAIATAVSVGWVVRNARHESTERKELRQFIVTHTGPEEKGLMYPEGDRVSWPRKSVWYLPGKDTVIVMTSTNDSEVACVLRQDGVDYVVVKKYLIRNRNFAPASGYTTSFIRLLRNSPKFDNVFDNSQFSVYRVRSAETARADGVSARK